MSTTAANPFDGSPITIHADRLGIKWALGYDNGLKRVIETRKTANARFPVNLDGYVAFIHTFAAEAKARKWAGFIWVSCGDGLIIISQEKKKLDWTGLRPFIGGGYVERAQCMIDGRRIPLIVDEDGALKGLQQNPVGTRLYGRHISGEGMIPLGATGWGY
jgi:hypothetical protein